MNASSPDITFCLKRIGKDTAGWDTLVVAGAADTITPPEDLWAAWSDLERWPLWSPLHRSVTGTPEAGCRPVRPSTSRSALASPSAPPSTPPSTCSNPGAGQPGQAMPTALGTVICGASPHCPTASPAGVAALTRAASMRRCRSAPAGEDVPGQVLDEPHRPDEQQTDGMLREGSVAFCPPPGVAAAGR
jgi:hypothetical protein